MYRYYFPLFVKLKYLFSTALLLLARCILLFEVHYYTIVTDKPKLKHIVCLIILKSTLISQYILGMTIKPLNQSN